MDTASKPRSRAKENVVTLLAILLAIALGKLTSSRLGEVGGSAHKDNTQADISVPGMSYQGARRTVLVFLRSDCAFCAASMPFYQRLTALEHGGRSELRVVALSTETAEQTSRYLADHHLVVDEVVSLTAYPTAVPGTPTVLVVDEGGRLLGRWLGKQSQAGEREVEAILRSGLPSP